MRLRFSIVALSFFLCIQTAEGRRLPVVDIGIVMDGYADLRQRARDLLEPELIELMGGDYDVRIPEDKLVQGDGSIESVRRLIVEQLKDPSITMVVNAASAEEVLGGLDDRVEAVFVALPLFLGHADMEALVQGLIDRRLPSFSSRGEDVAAGVMVGLHSNTDLAKLARRVALNIERILLGEEPGDLTVVFRRSDRLMINMATARAMEIYPSWSVINEAEQIKGEVKPVARQLTLLGAVQEAMSANLDLAVMSRAVAAGEQIVRQARGRICCRKSRSACGERSPMRRSGARFSRSASSMARAG